MPLSGRGDARATHDPSAVYRRCGRSSGRLCPRSHHVNVVEDENQSAGVRTKAKGRGQVRSQAVDVQVVPNVPNEAVLVLWKPMDALLLRDVCRLAVQGNFLPR